MVHSNCPDINGVHTLTSQNVTDVVQSIFYSQAHIVLVLLGRIAFLEIGHCEVAAEDEEEVARAQAAPAPSSFLLPSVGSWPCFVFESSSDAAVKPAEAEVTPENWQAR